MLLLLLLLLPGQPAPCCLMRGQLLPVQRLLVYLCWLQHVLLWTLLLLLLLCLGDCMAALQGRATDVLAMMLCRSGAG